MRDELFKQENRSSTPRIGRGPSVLSLSGRQATGDCMPVGDVESELPQPSLLERLTAAEQQILYMQETISRLENRLADLTRETVGR